MSGLPLAFMGSPDFAVPTLSALLDNGHTIVRVYTQPPRPAGRGHRARRSAVHEAALACALPVATPERFDAAAVREFRALEIEAAIVVAYGLILPEAALAAPTHGCINLHASLLPRWRGAAPIQRAILASDEVTGVTTMQMDAGLDTGPTFGYRMVPITPETTFGSLHDQLAQLASKLAVETLARLVGARLTGSGLRPTPQDEYGMTYAARIAPVDRQIDWTWSAGAIERQVRAFHPSPGAWFSFAGERIKLLRADVLDHPSGQPGTVLNDQLTVACGVGAIRMRSLQRPGKRALSSKAFQRGFAMPAGARLTV